MTRTLSLTAAVFALCMSCGPEPESSTEGGTMPSSGAITCESLRGAHLRSVLTTFPSGLGPDGPLLGRQFLSFTADGRGYEWTHDDMTNSGSCSCSENVVRADEAAAAALDPLTGILTWNGIEFERVK